MSRFPQADTRRLDLIVPGLGVDRGLPLFCDVTCVTPITGRGFARSGATTINGAILRDATRDNVANYREVVESGSTRRLVARAVLRDAGADIVTTLLEDPPGIADLPVSAFWVAGWAPGAARRRLLHGRWVSTVGAPWARKGSMPVHG